ncbi:hypothetical protein EUTSA_v10002119mg [Eutrema salsugineum]|uniref:Uncharacterized protein n=1 Tax=Eutrema salsugineum TaxID=72664 RepID=V4NTQ1_EUTSA|nr:hypothetical protein EUTSA_v10002119mg [Eutrema salsugineum]
MKLLVLKLKSANSAEETIKMRRNLEGDEHRSSNMLVPPSVSRQCGGEYFLKNTATTYHSEDEFSPSPGDSLSYYCRKCDSLNHCTIYLCTTIEHSVQCKHCSNKIYITGQNFP